MNEYFRQFAQKTAAIVGSAWTFVTAVALIIIWAVTGPIFGFSDTWQLIINTSTTIVTFLMVFLIQNTQNRDAKAIHLKLDELLRGIEGPRTDMVDLEELSDEELDQFQQEFRSLHQRYLKPKQSTRDKKQADDQPPPQRTDPSSAKNKRKNSALKQTDKVVAAK